MGNLEKEFFDFIAQRQLIWHRRFVEKEEPPWTRDGTLQTYKILNVYRELDKGTQYILDRLEGIKDRKALLLNIVFYRFFNKFNLYGGLGIKPFERFDKKLMEELSLKLEKLKKEGQPIFNDAYLIAGRKNEAKYVSVLNSILWLSNNIDIIIGGLDKANTAEESFFILKEVPLVGNFLAYEIWTDLSYFKFFKQSWTDNDFVNIGPGASWGLKLIYGNLNKRDEMEKIGYLHSIQKNYLHNDWFAIYNKKAFSNTPFLSLRNIEHSLCEFRKYWNLKNGKGKRRIFKPLTNPLS